MVGLKYITTNKDFKDNDCYGCEVWTVNSDTKRKLLGVDMDYLGRRAIVSRLQRVNNKDIRQRLDANGTILKRINIPMEPQENNEESPVE